MEQGARETRLGSSIYFRPAGASSITRGTLKFFEGTRNRYMLDDLWIKDQQGSGLCPVAHVDPCGRIGHPHLCVNEQAIASAGPNNPVSGNILFPCTVWPGGSPPETYKSFCDFLKYVNCEIFPPEDGSRKFMRSIARTPVMDCAREMLKELDDALYRGCLDSNDDWVEYLRKFWFILNRSRNGMSATDLSAEQDSLKDLLERYRQQEDSNATVDEAMGWFGDDPKIIAALFAMSPAKLVDKWSQIQKQADPSQQHNLAILRQLAFDMEMIHRRRTANVTDAFRHILVGEYDARARDCKRKLGGYHFWYKYSVDASDKPDAVSAHGLQYRERLEGCQGRHVVQATTFKFSLQLEEQSGCRPLIIEEGSGGFLNGCSPEGLMALCMVAFFRKRKSYPNWMCFGGPSPVVELEVHSGAQMGYPNQLATVYPKVCE